MCFWVVAFRVCDRPEPRPDLYLSGVANKFQASIPALKSYRSPEGRGGGKAVADGESF